jgi:hypothetical protein
MNLDFIKKYSAEDISQAEVDDFERWLKDESYIEEYGIYEFLKDDVLLRVYKYVPEEDTENPLFDDRGKPLGATKERVCPIAKVIKVGTNNNLNLSPGDHVALIDGISMKTLNPKYLDWSERQDERPLPKGDRPEVYIYGLEKLQHFTFVKDKLFGAQDDDDLTLLLPDTLIRAKINFGV